MNIQTVAANLRNTIAGKEAMLERLVDGNDTGLYTLRHMLVLNIKELKAILADVDACG